MLSYASLALPSSSIHRNGERTQGEIEVGTSRAYGGAAGCSTFDGGGATAGAAVGVTAAIPIDGAPVGGIVDVGGQGGDGACGEGEVPRSLKVARDLRQDYTKLGVRREDAVHRGQRVDGLRDGVLGNSGGRVRGSDSSTEMGAIKNK